MKVPFVNFPLQYQNMKDEIDLAIHSCLERGDFINRQDLWEFEENFASFIGVKHAVGVLSCTDALFLSLKAFNIGPGDEVITVDNTYIATIDVIVACGATPVLVDVDPDTMNMNMDMFEQAITEKTQAVIPVHLNGRMADMKRCLEIAERNFIIVIEDAAQAAGAELCNKNAGSYGNVGCFSFYPSKPLGTIGEGGMITTDNDQVYDKLLKLRHHGDEPGKKRGKIHCWGYNSILENISAAVLNKKLSHLVKWNVRRREIAHMYHESLRELVACPLYPDALEEYYDIYAYYMIRTEKRDELALFLKEKGIDTMVYLSTPNSMQPELKDKIRVYDYGYIPVTKSISETSLCLPMYPELTDEQVDYVCEAVRSFFE